MRLRHSPGLPSTNSEMPGIYGAGVSEVTESETVQQPVALCKVTQTRGGWIGSAVSARLYSSQVALVQNSFLLSRATEEAVQYRCSSLSSLLYLVPFQELGSEAFSYSVACVGENGDQKSCVSRLSWRFHGSLSS